MPRRRRIRIRRGLDLALPGAPAAEIDARCDVRSVALVADAHPRLHLRVEVEPGDRVRLGDVLCRDRRRPQIRFTAPASGVVSAVVQGEMRRLRAVRIERAGDERREFARPAALSREHVVALLLEAGEWVSLRSRPFGNVADPARTPAALFVRAMDTNPLAPQAGAILEGREEDLRSGLGALATLTPGPVFVCTDPAGSARIPDCGRARVVEFEGPHPAGLVGTHIHHLFPLGEAREVWYTGVQDALAIGRLCRTGSLDPERVIALAGPRVRRPRLLRTRLGASTEELVQGELEPGACRILAGSPLSGRRAASGGAFLGRFDEQLCVLPEEAEPGPEAWLVPEAGGARRFPPWRARPRWTGALHGRPRPLLPLDLFDRVVPLRLPLGLLLRSLAARHADGARSFGALELEEEDLALCTFLCASKLEYGPLLRAALGELESERP